MVYSLISTKYVLHSATPGLLESFWNQCFTFSHFSDRTIISVAILEIHIAFKEIRIRLLVHFQGDQEALLHLPVWSNLHYLCFILSFFLSLSLPLLFSFLSLIVLVQWVTLNHHSEDHCQMHRNWWDFYTQMMCMPEAMVLSWFLFFSSVGWRFKTNDAFFMYKDLVIFFYFSPPNMLHLS